MNPKVKNILIFVGILVVVVVAYKLIFKSTPATPAKTTTASLPVTSTTGSTTATGTTQTAPKPVVGQEFLSMLLSVKTIRIDDSIFTSSAFESLSDSSIQLVSEDNQGRENPFAPIGSDGTATQPTEMVNPITTTTDNGITIPTSMLNMTGTPPLPPASTTLPADNTTH